MTLQRGSDRRLRRARWIALGAFSLVLPFLLSAGGLSTAVFVVIAAIGAVGLNVLTGYAGQISLGHAFFLAVGAYTGAVVGGDHHLTAAIWLPAAGIVAALFGALVGPIALRLRGLYLAIVTLGLVYIGQYLFYNLTGVTGGPPGRAFPAVAFGSSLNFSPGNQLQLAGLTLDSNALYYFLALLILWLAVAFTFNLQRTRIGRAFQAVRERELAASVMGLDLARTKVAAFVISSFLAGISGALFASYLSYVVPTQWDLLLSGQFVAAIIVGGMGTVLGPVLGSIVVFALPDAIQHISFVNTNGTGGITPGDLSNIIYGVLIVAFLVAEPRGIVGLGDRLASLLGERRRRRGYSGPRGPSSEANSTTGERVLP
ncbi:MAG: branched-chain amino acid ABC transporter permease [Solirubrobacteraceae bacterium]